MKLHLANTGQQNVIAAYGDGYVQINADRRTASVMVSGAAVEDWPVKSIREMTAANLEPAVRAKPEIVIVGTGKHFHFPSPATLRPLIDARIGYEIMDTAAACRTYNILLGEGRNVMAVLVVE
jgi:uncharacterized protein